MDYVDLIGGELPIIGSVQEETGWASCRGYLYPLGFNQRSRTCRRTILRDILQGLGLGDSSDC